MTREPGTSRKSTTFLLLQMRAPVGTCKEVFSAPVDDPTDIARSAHTFNQPIRSFFPGPSRTSITFSSGGFFGCKPTGTLVPASANAIHTE